MLLVELCVSRSVRDTAGVLDAVHGRTDGETISAPAPARPFIKEVGADPGKLRIGLLTHNPLETGEIHPDCVAAARDTAQLLESLGHTVEEAFPAGVVRPELVAEFTTLWTVTLAYNVRYWERKVGHEATPDDVEALTWSLLEMGTRDPRPPTMSTRNTRWVSSAATSTPGSRPATTCCSPPPSASRRRELGEFTTPDEPFLGFIRAASFVPYTPLANMAGTPAISLPLSWNDRDLPIGSMLMGAYGREDLLLRVASTRGAAVVGAHSAGPRLTAWSRLRAVKVSTAIHRPRSTHCSPRASTTSAWKRWPS